MTDQTSKTSAVEDEEVPMTEEIEADRTAIMTVRYHLTKQAEPYTNIRCGVDLPVFVTPEDDVYAAMTEALDEARVEVQALVDEEYEAYDKPAPYDPGPRYKLLMIRSENLAAIFRQSFDPPGDWSQATVLATGHRLNYIRRIVEKPDSGLRDYTIIDCIDGDLTHLPKIAKLILAIERNRELAILHHHHTTIPDDITDQLGDLGRSYHLGLLGSGQRWAIDLVKREMNGDQYQIFDVSQDNDWDSVRKWLAARPPETKEAEEIEWIEEAEYPDDFNETWVDEDEEIEF